MKRSVEPEWLDELPAHDCDAIRSRKDLQRINGLMGHIGLMTRLLANGRGGKTYQRIIELGAGDGTFLLRLACRLGPQLNSPKVILMDRQPVVSRETCEGFRQLGWEVEIVSADVFKWLAQSHDSLAAADTAIVANLFLHHFQDNQLRTLFRQVAITGHTFAACEPRRSGFALTASRFLGVIGCNAVTRHDAVISVRAGFAGSDLSRLWPPEGPWQLREKAGGFFSHCFLAQRRA